MSKAYVIAEVGSNWHTIEDCLASIHAAKDAKADAVKFQLFTRKDLYGYGECELGETPYLHPCWLATLAKECESLKIDFMCSAFSPEGVALVDPYVAMHKVASAELTHVELLKAVRACNKPVVISMGACDIDEITQALEELQGVDITLCYCVSSYPSHQYNLFAIDKLRRLFGKKVRLGFSDHSKDIYPVVSAVRHFGVQLVEKHFKYDYNLTTQDAEHAIGPIEFQKMVELIEDPTAIWMPDLMEEQDMILMHKRRIMATAHIAPGDKLVLNQNYGVFRSVIRDESFIPGFDCFRIDGKTAQKNILPGFAIQKGDFI